MNLNKSHKRGVSLVEIGSAQLNQRLDNFLLGQLGNVPRTRVYRIIRKGEVRVNKKRSKPDYRLQIGDLVRIPPLWNDAAQDRSQVLPPRWLRRLEQSILYENKHLLIVDKPSGLAVHSGSGVAYGCIDLMRALRPDDDIELAHRLDRDTSGCLLMAKHRAALLALQRAIIDGSLKKNYIGLTRGKWPVEKNEITHALSKFHLANGERRVRVDPAGKPACSRVSLLQSGREYSLIAIALITGRTHQIRVHCQAEGHPLAGDDKYGDDDFNRMMRQRGIKRLMLHASSLELPGSDYTSEIVINAPPPSAFEAVFDSGASGSTAQEKKHERQ